MREGVLDDLATEGFALEKTLMSLDDADWQRATASPGWTISHQVAHLMSTDLAVLASAAHARGPLSMARFLTRRTHVAALASHLPPTFRWLSRNMTSPGSPDLSLLIDAYAHSHAARSPSDVLSRWRTTRNELNAVLASVPDHRKLRWIGPPMSATSMATARLMETWAHGRDIEDALGKAPLTTTRLRHIADLGVRTRGYAFRVNGLTPPTDDFRVQLMGPNDHVWSWGPADARQRIEGDALDFCLLVTQRRHLSDLNLAAIGAEAQTWLRIAQAFAGPPGQGRAPAAESRA